MRWMATFLALVVLWAATATACSLCAGGPNFGRLSLREEAILAKHVFYGTLSNPRLNAANAAGAANASATDFTIDQVVKSQSSNRASQRHIVIPRYVHVDAKAPPKYLVFCDENDGKLDFYRGTPVKSAALVDYLRTATAIAPKDTAKILDFAGQHLDHPDADVANEAFMELARAEDAAVLAAAKRIDAKRIRKLIDDPKTPTERLSLFVYILGSCGTPSDAEWIKSHLKTPSDRYRSATSGLYAGLITINAAEGWSMLFSVLADDKRPFQDRMAALSALRFHRNVDPKTNRDKIVRGLQLLLPQGDIADMAIEDLRKWSIWDLTPIVIDLFGRESHNAPLMKRSLIRYGITCPSPEAKAFIAKVRSAQPELVKEVEEGLQYEKSP